MQRVLRSTIAALGAVTISSCLIVPALADTCEATGDPLVAVEAVVDDQAVESDAVVDAVAIEAEPATGLDEGVLQDEGGAIEDACADDATVPDVAAPADTIDGGADAEAVDVPVEEFEAVADVEATEPQSEDPVETAEAEAISALSDGDLVEAEQTECDADPAEEVADSAQVADGEVEGACEDPIEPEPESTDDVADTSEQIDLLECSDATDEADATITDASAEDAVEAEAAVLEAEDSQAVEPEAAEAEAEDPQAAEPEAEEVAPSEQLASAPKTDAAKEESVALEAPEKEAKPDGWVTKDGEKYYYKSGSPVTGQQVIEGKSYYFRDDGTMVSGKFVRHLSKGMTMYYDAKGQAQYGEKNVHGCLYYFDPTSGASTESAFVYQKDEKKTTYHDDLGHALFGTQQIDGSSYYFDYGTGARAESRLVTLGAEAKTVYYDSDGKMAFGERIIDGVRHFFQQGTGALYKAGYQNPSGYFQVSSLNVTLPHSGASWPFNYATPSKIGVYASRSDCIETMIDTAWDYLGTTYVWDYSCEPGVGVDCAGLVMQCLYATGIDLGYDYNPYDHFYTYGHDHYANDMSGDSRFQWVSLGARQRGDLIFYPGHVAIYLGGDQIIEAYPGYVMTNSIWAHGTPTVVRRVYVEN